MFGDILVGALLVISGIINLLAIGAFWITPSLRTTANRFVINLLLVNFISCLILSPFAFNAFNVNANSPTGAIASPPSPPTTFNYNNTSEFLSSDVVVEVIENSGNKTECSNRTLECLTNDESDNLHLLDAIENISLRMYQTWSLDLAVALSVLSVLLVILDTFIAVTDPLRYHARISDCKAWLLIALCWVLSITFGIASALRVDASLAVNSENFANIIFLLTYFLLIIISPFMLVILMYWRIYSEARENGQRMRQNGSSPLLQSALNLAATAAAHQQQSQILTNPQCVLLLTSSPIHGNKQPPLNKQPPCDNIHNYFQTNNNNNNSTHVNDGLTMRIDKQDYCNNNNSSQQINLNINGICINNSNGSKTFSDTKTYLLSSPPHECMPMLDALDETSHAPKSQQHQNILLTLTTVCEQTIKRNHSVKHLLADTELGDEAKVVELRQVQSTPNLQHTSSSSMDAMNNGQEQTLELPSIQASPKALRYMTSLRHRLSNASSLFKYREEGRAARISILVVIMFLITYLPYGILSLVHGQEGIIKESNIKLLSIIFVLLANLCSPIIFAYRNKRVRRGVRRLLGVDKKTNERLEKLNSLKRTCSTRIKNYRQNNLHKSLNLGIKGTGIKASNIRRTQSFVTCNYLTPPDAAKISINNTLDSIDRHKGLANAKEKKSILKIVADSSKKFRCQFSINCQTGINQETLRPVEV